MMSIQTCMLFSKLYPEKSDFERHCTRTELRLSAKCCYPLLFSVPVYSVARLATSVRALAHTPLRKRAWGLRFEPDGGWFRDLEISGYHGPLHGDLKGRATGPFRRTSGGEAVSPAAGWGQRHRYIKPEYLYLLPLLKLWHIKSPD